jgi:hypothetical protein
MVRNLRIVPVRRTLRVYIYLCFGLVTYCGNLISACKVRALNAHVESDRTPERLSREELQMDFLTSTPDQMLNKASDFYFELYRRFQKDGPDFPIPEFANTATRMENHLNDMIAKIPANNSPSRINLLTPIELTDTKILEMLRKENPSAFADEYSNGLAIENFKRDMDDLNEKVKDFNATLTRKCLQERKDKLLSIIYGSQTPPHTSLPPPRYQSFIQGLEYFSEAISVPCAKDDLDEFEPYTLTCRFPAFCLPALFQDLPESSFSAIAHVPLLWIGVTPDTSITDFIPMTPRDFLMHDHVHGVYSLTYDRPSWLKDLVQPQFMADKTFDIADLYWTILEKQPKAAPWRPVPFLSSEAKMHTVLNKRQSYNQCIQGALSKDARSKRLKNIFFWHHHEYFKPITAMPEPMKFERFPEGPGDARTLATIMTSCLAQAGLK